MILVSVLMLVMCQAFWTLCARRASYQQACAVTLYKISNSRKKTKHVNQRKKRIQARHTSEKNLMCNTGPGANRPNTVCIILRSLGLESQKLSDPLEEPTENISANGPQPISRLQVSEEEIQSKHQVCWFDSSALL